MRAAISFAFLLLFSGTALAQKVGAADIGGVVTGPNGPEAGVWVIAETTDLPTKFAKIVVTDDRAATSFPTCPRRTTACGCAATARRLAEGRRPRPGKALNLRAVTAPSAQRRPNTTRRSTGTRC